MEGSACAGACKEQVNHHPGRLSRSAHFLEASGGHKAIGKAERGTHSVRVGKPLRPNPSSPSCGGHLANPEELMKGLREWKGWENNYRGGPGGRRGGWREA